MLQFLMRSQRSSLPLARTLAALFPQSARGCIWPLRASPPAAPIRSEASAAGMSPSSASMRPPPPKGFCALEMPAAFTGARLDHYLRSAFIFTPLASAAQALRTDSTAGARAEGGAGLDASGAVPLSVLHSWCRKRLLRAQHCDDGSGAIVIPIPAGAAAARGKGGDALRMRLGPGTAVFVHPTILRALERRSGPGSGAGALGGAGGGIARATAAMRPPAWLAPSLRHVSASCVVIAKPAGIATQGGAGIPEARTVDFWLPAIESAAAAQLAASDALTAAADAAAGRRGGRRPASLPPPREAPLPAPPASGDAALKLVHRLDVDVSGLLLLARGRASAERCRAALSARAGIGKEYLALVAAALPPGAPLEGFIDSPLRSTEAAGASGAQRRGAGAGAADEAGGAEALTEYIAFPLQQPTPASRSGGSAAGSSAPPPASPLTLLVLTPVTGRKHQLRRHVLALFRDRAGIAGDAKYGRGAREDGGGGPGALCLHAWRLTLDADIIGDGGNARGSGSGGGGVSGSGSASDRHRRRGDGLESEEAERDAEAARYDGHDADAGDDAPPLLLPPHMRGAAASMDASLAREALWADILASLEARRSPEPCAARRLGSGQTTLTDGRLPDAFVRVLMTHIHTRAA